jgi:hypothetical protein
MLGPALLEPGIVLRGDMVFVPSQPWKDAWLGLDGSVPRAVPMDALVSVGTQVVSGAWLQKSALLLSFVVGGVGVGRLAQLVVGASTWGVASACTVFLWNPWVVERLSIGQWATVAGYALLPWVVTAALRARDEHRWSGLFVALVLSAVCSPSSGVSAVLVAGVVVLTRPRLRLLLVFTGCATLANMPWLLPAITLGGQVDLVDRAGFASFRARGESPLGLLPSVLSLGGIWKASVVPAERTSSLVVLVAAGVSVLAVAALLRGRGRPDRAREALLGIGLLSIVTCVAPAWAPGALSTASDVLPGLAMLRDSHRFLAPLALPLAIGTSALVEDLRRRAVPGNEGLLVVGGTLVVIPTLLLPGALWGISGDLRAVTFPDEWSTVADQLAAAGTPGAVVVLPWEGSYRRFYWNDRRASLDPAPRALPGEVIVDDRIVVGDALVPGEDPVPAQVTRAIHRPDAAEALSALGVRWVLVEDPLPAGYAVPDGRVVHDGTSLRLVDLGPPIGTVPHRVEGRWRRWTILGADAVVLTAFCCAVGLSVVHRRIGRYAPPRT